MNKRRRKREKLVAVGKAGGAELSVPEAVLARRGSEGWTIGVLLLVLAMGCALGFREIYSPDIGFIIAYGRLILERGAFPMQEPFTWTVAENVVKTLPWLSNIGQALVFDHLGSRGIVVMGIVLTLLVPVACLGRRAASGCRPGAADIVLIFLFLAGNSWETRLHQLSWQWLGLVLWAGEAARRGRDRAVWWWPVIILVWANSHSLFVLGLVVAGAWLAARVIETRRIAAMPTAAAGASMLTAFLTPYGLRGALHPFEQLGMLQGGSVFKSETMGTAEFLATFRWDYYHSDGGLVIWQPMLFVHLLGAVSIVATAAGWKHWNWFERLLVVAFGYLFVIANKNVGYFFIAAYLPLARGLEIAGTRLGQGICRGGGWRRAPAAVVGAASLIILLQVKSGYWHERSRSGMRWGCGINAAVLPVKSCEFLARSGVKGRVLNTFGDGGYVRMITGLPVFIYGLSETMTPAFFGRYLLFNDLRAFRREIESWHSDIALFDFGWKPHWLYHFLKTPGWRCIYCDERDVIFVRQGVADHLPEVDLRQAPATEVPRMMAALEKGLAASEPGLLGSLSGRHYLPRSETRVAGRFLAMGDRRGALAWATAGFERATLPCPELLLIAAQALQETRNFDLAERCYLRAGAWIRDGVVEKHLAAMRRQRGAGP